MPAFSFKERFVPMVKDGSKRQTIRAFRKTPVKPGQLAHLYYGMRTVHCKKLVEQSPLITDVKCILMGAEGEAILIDTNWLTPNERVQILSNGYIPDIYGSTILPAHLKNALAWNDGFRDDDGDINKSFELMQRWWSQTHSCHF